MWYVTQDVSSVASLPVWRPSRCHPSSGVTIVLSGHLVPMVTNVRCNTLIIATDIRWQWSDSRKTVRPDTDQTLDINILALVAAISQSCDNLPIDITSLWNVDMSFIWRQWAQTAIFDWCSPSHLPSVMSRLDYDQNIRNFNLNDETDCFITVVAGG